MTETTFTKEQWKEFKKVYEKAKEENGEDSVFEYMGEKFYVKFAKYLIEYYDPKFQ